MVVENDVLEKSSSQSDIDDGEKYSHYVKKDKIVESAVTGKKVIALCGKKWTPCGDPSSYPICPDCKKIYEMMKVS